MSMVSNCHFLLILVLIFLPNPSSNFCSSCSEQERDFRQWISRNMEIYRRKTALKPESICTGGKLLEEKLRIAEANSITLSVSQDGGADFRSIGEALNSISSYNTHRAILSIQPGIYREKIYIPRTLPFITFSGNSSKPPTITGNDTASMFGKDGKPLRTLQSATVAIDADYFVAINIKFESRYSCWCWTWDSASQHVYTCLLRPQTTKGIIQPEYPVRVLLLQSMILADSFFQLFLKQQQNAKKEKTNRSFKIMKSFIRCKWNTNWQCVEVMQNTAPHVVGSIGGQAVALRISGTKAAFYNCSFYGSQDTLYDHRGLHYFNNCFIQGSIDFIFGYGISFYENCTLNSVAKKGASLTAQKRTNSSLTSGFSFKDCKIIGSGSVYLGRAWGEYSRVVFSYTYMENIIMPQGWSDWGKQANNWKVYYGEYKCRGPGANRTGRVPWARLLSDEEALPFVGTYYVNGDAWITSPIPN